jgi:hypothetical protein
LGRFPPLCQIHVSGGTVLRGPLGEAWVKSQAAARNKAATRPRPGRDKAAAAHDASPPGWPGTAWPKECVGESMSGRRAARVRERPGASAAEWPAAGLLDAAWRLFKVAADGRSALCACVGRRLCHANQPGAADKSSYVLCPKTYLGV